MDENKNVTPFDQDAIHHGGYLYTKTTRLSDQMATQRSTDVILQMGHLAGRSILDLGCGDGFYTYRFWDQGHPRSMVGLDMADNAIQIARANKGNRQITFEVGDAHHVVYPDNSFDMVLIQSILHHDDDPLGVIREGFRLAPEILIHEPNGNSPILKIIEKLSLYHREHRERSYSFPQMMAWIEQAGGRATAHQFAGLVPMFSPDWIALPAKRVEPLIERVPFSAYWGCAIYAITAIRQ